ncbi:WD40-repeat-containing domain protein [Pelagophyceae sp. CCMP2097]|nr:WD40-repeat-containing domain protein [Pelagophyceae sp. CCMP2097]
MRAGNVNQAASTGAGGHQYGELSATSKQEQLRHAALLKRVDAERRARKIVVPTNDTEVRGMLRKLGHPVRLFGETVADVRERLREILARIEIEGEERDLVAAILAAPDPFAPADLARAGRAGPQQSTASHDPKTDVYTPASAELNAARRRMAAYSFPRASARLAESSKRRDDDEARSAREESTAAAYASLASLALSQSQFADARPLARIRVGPAGDVVATAAWSGAAKVWDLETCNSKCAIKGHKERCTGLAWAPRKDKHVVVTAGADGLAKLWDCSFAPAAADDMDVDGPPAPAAKLPDAVLLQTFTGHSERLGHVDFHPSGHFFATTSFDSTWRLWDVETAAELLLQDGHAFETYAVSFQGDGALVATGDFGGVGHVWDLRSGRRLWSALGHGKKVLCAAWSPDGYTLATGSDDHTVRIWDLRKRACAYTLPAHSSLVADVRFSPETGEALATCAFDGRVKLWSTRDWSTLTSLAAHDGKCTSVDFIDDGRVVSAGFDRTFKIWQPQDAAEATGYE